MAKILISDYDGTVTRNDFYSLLAERYIPADAPDFFAQYRAGLITHFQAMAAYFAYAPTVESALEALVPGLTALLVQPGYRFARGFLAGDLRARGEGFRPFERWSEVAVGCAAHP